MHLRKHTHKQNYKGWILNLAILPTHKRLSVNPTPPNLRKGTWTYRMGGNFISDRYKVASLTKRSQRFRIGLNAKLGNLTSQLTRFRSTTKESKYSMQQHNIKQKNLLTVRISILPLPIHMSNH